jgi:DNA-damage-inducible protein J
MYMNTTSLHIKIEPKVKEEAQKAAEDLGLSLSAVTKALLRQFVRTRRLSVGELPEIPNAKTAAALRQSEEDIKAGRGRSFKNMKEMLAYVDSLIEFSPLFLKRLAEAPTEIKFAFREAAELFSENPNHPILRRHTLTGKYQDFVSIDVTEDWRALYREEPERIMFVNIGTHATLYG